MKEGMNTCTKHLGWDLSSSFSTPRAFSQHVPHALTDAQNLPEKDQSWLTYHQEAKLPSRGGWPQAASKKQEGTVVYTVAFKKMPWAVQVAEQARKDRAKGYAGHCTNTLRHTPLNKEDVFHFSEGLGRIWGSCWWWRLTLEHFHSSGILFTCIGSSITTLLPQFIDEETEAEQD